MGLLSQAINVIRILNKKGYKETDVLGGIDPYSASKASAEILLIHIIKPFLLKIKTLGYVLQELEM